MKKDIKNCDWKNEKNLSLKKYTVANNEIRKEEITPNNEKDNEKQEKQLQFNKY